MRIEVEGGLYHIITRGVARQDIFHDANDHARFIRLLAGLKERLPFYLYAFDDGSHPSADRTEDGRCRADHAAAADGYAQYSKDMNNRRYDRRESQYRKSDPDLFQAFEYRVS